MNGYQKKAASAAFFILLHSFFAQVLSFSYFIQAGLWPTTFESWVFFTSYWFSHFVFLGFIFFVFTSPFSLLLFDHRFFRILFSFVASLLLVLLIIDSFVYSQYRFHLNAIVLDLFIHGKGQIISFPLSTWLLVIFFFVVLWGFSFWSSEFLLFRIFKNFSWVRKYLGFVVFCFFFSHLFYAFHDARYNNSVAKVAAAFPLSEPLKAKSFLSKIGVVDLEEYKRRKSLKKLDLASELKYPLSPLVLKPQQVQNFHILWLVVDSLRFDMMSPDVMPNTHELSQMGATFYDHFSNSNTTRHGIFGLFYGLPGAYFDSALRTQTEPLLMKRLRELDYRFYIYANAPLTKPEFDQTVFSEIKDLRKFSQSHTVDGRDQEITDLMIEALKSHNQNEKFFGFLFFDAPHGYAYPKNYKKPFQVESDGFSYLALNKNSDREPILNIYKNSVHFVDSLIGQILKELKQKNLFENTIILITGDHGQELNDLGLGYWGHNSNYSRFQTQVPLVIYWPGLKPIEVRHRTTHYDISATFLKQALGVTNPTADLGSGHSLFVAEPPRDWILMGRESDYAVYEKNQILVVKPTGDYEAVDLDYKPLERAEVDFSNMRHALSEMTRFLAR